MAMKEGCGLDGSLPSLLYSLPGCHVNASVYMKIEKPTRCNN